MTSITRTITINVQTGDNDQYLCQLSSPNEPTSNEIRCCGQSEEHAIANALEQLASQYRQIAEELQNTDWEAVEHSASGEPIQKRYHVILHYERIRTAESKFDALQDTLLGNTVVENAKVNLIEIDASLLIQPLT
jgi:phosphoribosylformylglycinamidine (FGAM) synthase PurS component